MSLFDHFGLIAPFYDRAMPFSRLDGLMKVVELPADGMLLDAGGGTGRVAGQLRTLVRDVVIVDISDGMLKQAGKKGLKAVQTETENLPFARDSFERIIMVDALHHVINHSRTIQELWRLLKPGGRLVIEEPDVNHWQVKLLAVVERLLLMRSYFLPPDKIMALFPADATMELQHDGYTCWVIVCKK